MLQSNVCKKPNRTKDTLFEIANNVWNEIPTEEFLKLIDSMPRRVDAVIKAKGGYTKY